MIQSVVIPGIAHVQNPVWLQVKAGANEYIQYDIVYNNSVAFSLSATTNAAGDLQLNIADLLKLLLDSAPADYSKFTAGYQVNATSQGVTVSATGTCVMGGIRNILFRELNSSDSNIFTDRLFNNNRNRLLTSRTTGSTIVLRETELTPFIILTSGASETLSVIATATSYSVNISLSSTYKAAVIDIPAIRRNMYFQQDVGGNTIGFLFPTFDIQVNNVSICKIIILPAAAPEKNRALMFRNSFGAYEMIELSGDVTYNPTFEKAVDYLKYDATIDDYTRQRNRAEAVPVYDAAIGYKTPEELYFIHDMLLSDDTYLMAGGKQYPCTVDAENPVIAADVKEPRSVQLSIKLKDNENGALNDPDNPEVIWRSRWQDFICQKTTSNANTGKAIAKTLLTVKMRRNGTKFSGYPQSVSVLSAYSGFPAISETEYALLSDTDFQARIAAVKTQTASKYGIANLGEVNEAIQTDVESCPISGEQVFFDVVTELIGSGTPPPSLKWMFIVDNHQFPQYFEKTYVNLGALIKVTVYEDPVTGLYAFDGFYNMNDPGTKLPNIFNIFEDTTFIARWKAL